MEKQQARKKVGISEEYDDGGPLYLSTDKNPKE